MSKPKRYISKVSKKGLEYLLEGKKTGKSEGYRTRCHGIILSYRGYSVEEIAEFFEVTKITVYNWMNRWEASGIEGLKTQPGQGRKPLLQTDNKHHVKAVKKAMKLRAEKGTNFLLKIQEELELEDEVTMKMLRPFLKKLVTYGSGLEEE